MVSNDNDGDGDNDDNSDDVDDSQIHRTELLANVNTI